MALWNQPYLILTLTTLFWGGNAVAARIAPGHISPMVLTAGRWVLALMLIFALFGAIIRREWPNMLRYWKTLLLYGILGFLAFNVFAYIAGSYTTAINMGIVQGTIPLFVLIGAYVAFRTPVTRLQMIGVAVTLAGLVVLASQGSFAILRNFAFNPGDLLMIGACFTYALYTVALRARPPLPTFAFFAGCAMGGFVGSLPLLGVEIALGKALWPDTIGWWVLAYSVIFPSVVSQILFMRGVELIGPGRAGLFVNLVPVWASILGPLLLGETFASYHAVALALVLGGIGVAEWGKNRAPA